MRIQLHVRERIRENYDLSTVGSGDTFFEWRLICSRTFLTTCCVISTSQVSPLAQASSSSSHSKSCNKKASKVSCLESS